METVPLEEGSLMATLLLIHSFVPRTAQITTKDPRLVRKLPKNVSVFFVVGMVSAKQPPGRRQPTIAGECFRPGHLQASAGKWSRVFVVN